MRGQHRLNKECSITEDDAPSFCGVGRRGVDFFDGKDLQDRGRETGDGLGVAVVDGA